MKERLISKHAEDLNTSSRLLAAKFPAGKSRRVAVSEKAGSLVFQGPQLPCPLHWWSVSLDTQHLVSWGIVAMTDSHICSVCTHSHHHGVSLGHGCCGPSGEPGWRVVLNLKPGTQKGGKTDLRKEKWRTNSVVLRKPGKGVGRKKDKKFLSVNFPFSEQLISW